MNGNNYISKPDCIKRYLTAIKLDGYKIKIEKSSDKMVFSKDGESPVTISAKTIVELERNIRLFRRGLPQPSD